MILSDKFKLNRLFHPTTSEHSELVVEHTAIALVAVHTAAALVPVHTAAALVPVHTAAALVATHIAVAVVNQADGKEFP